MQNVYIAIDLKSFYASVECVERGLDPLKTNLVVADSSRTEKTICLAVSPSLKSYGIPGRARLFEVVQKAREINTERRYKAHIKEFRERKMALIVRRCLRKSAHAAVAVALFTAVFAAAQQFSSCASDKAVETVYLGTPAHVWWETDTTGKWSSVSKAHEYQVKLYIADGVDRDEDNWRKVDFDDEGMKEAECVMTKRTGETSCDFSAYMDDLHTYFFVVRATPKVSEQAYVKACWQWSVSSVNRP